MRSLVALWRLRTPTAWILTGIAAAMLSAAVWLFPTPAGAGRTERAISSVALIVPFALGRLAYLSMLPVIGSPLLWAVPRSRTVLRKGSAGLGVLIALSIGFVQWRLTGFESGIYTLALALLAYNSWACSAWLGEWRPRVGARLFAWLHAFPFLAIIVVVTAPAGAVTSAGHVASSVVIGMAVVSVAVAVRSASDVSSMRGARRAAQAVLQISDESDAHSRPPTQREFGIGPLGWAKACAYETISEKGGKWALSWAVDTIVIAFVTERMLSIAPVLAIALATINVWRALRVRALPLSAGIFHPAPRLTRATVSFWSRVAATMIRAGVLLGLVGVFEAIFKRVVGAPTHVSGFPLGTALVSEANGTLALLSLAVGVFVVIGLITQISRADMSIALGGTLRRHTVGPYASYLMQLLPALTGAIAFAHWANTEDIVREAVAVIVLLIATLVFYWFALRRSSLTIDLA